MIEFEIATGYNETLTIFGRTPNPNSSCDTIVTALPPNAIASMIEM